MAIRFDEIELSGSSNHYYPILKSSGHVLRSQSAHGYIDIGPGNTSYSHFTTDRPAFYFNNNVSFDGNISGYGTDETATFASFINRNDSNAYLTNTTLVLRSGDPTIYMRDTNHRSVALHTNSNRFYVLGAPTDSTGYTQINSVWPWYVQLDTNDVYTGNIGYAGNSYRAPVFYDSNNTAYYLDASSTGTSLNAAGELIGSNINTFIKYLGVGVSYDTDRSTKVTDGVALYGAYNGGSNSPHTYDFSAQFVGNSRGFELSAAWHSQPALSIRTLRDCCNNWSDWYKVAIHGLNNSGGALYASLLYDSNNTGYYVNPDASSKLVYLGLAADPNTSGGYRLNMGGSIDMNANSIDYVNQLHFNDNVRFYDDGNDSYLNFVSGDSNTTGIKFYSNAGNDFRGYVYGETGGFGLLDSDGNWSVRIPLGGSGLELRSNNNTEFTVNDDHTLSHGSSRAPIFYDSDDTNYFIDPRTATNGFKFYSAAGAFFLRGQTHWESNPGIDLSGGTSEFRFSSTGGNLNLRTDGWFIAHDYVRGTVFYDHNDTTYYLDPASGNRFKGITEFRTSSGNARGYIQATETNDEHFIIATSGGEDIAFKDGGTGGTTNMIIRGDGKVWMSQPLEVPSIGSTNSNVARVILPHGASYSGSGTVTGAFKIKLPVSWTNTMMSMRIVIYDYADGESFEIQCGGYNHTGSGGYWVNMFGHILADPDKDRGFNIRFGHDGSNCCIFIGETASTWSYPKVVVTEFTGGHAGYTHDNWDDGWAITAETSFPSNIDHTESLNQIGRHVDRLIDTSNTSYYMELDSTSRTNTIVGNVFSGDISTSGDGQNNYPFRLRYDYNAYMMTVASNTWGLFWAGNSGARYGTNGNGGPGNIWGNSGNPNEFVFVGSDSTKWTVYGNNGNTWQAGYGQASDSFRAPRFYDSNNTGYYVDPASTSFQNTISLNNYLEIRHSSPTVYLRDTNHNSAMLHTNSNIFYILRGGNDTTSWSQVNGVWPLEINLTNNNATFGATVTATNHLAANGGYLYLSSGNSIFSPSGGVIKTASNFYAERFYDYDDTTRYVDVNSTSYITTLHTSGTIQAGNSGTGNIYLGNTGVSGSGNHFRFHTNNSHTYFDGNCGDIHWRQGSSTRFYFYMTTANMTINGTLTQYSDERLKQNVVTIDNALNKVNQLRGVYYNRTDINTGANQIGLIAQETESVVPEVVHTANDELGTKSISYGQLNALLVEAIKEQQTIIDDLKSRIETLENQ